MAALRAIAPGAVTRDTVGRVRVTEVGVLVVNTDSAVGGVTVTQCYDRGFSIHTFQLALRRERDRWEARALPGVVGDGTCRR